MFRYLILSLVLVVSALFTRPATAQTNLITQVNGIPLPYLGGANLENVTFPSQGGWNLNNNAAFVKPGISTYSRTGVNIVLSGSQQVWGIIRPPTAPGGWESCYSVVTLQWVYGGTTRRGVGIWDHCWDIPSDGFVWFKMLPDLTSLGYTSGSGATEIYRTRIFLSATNVWNVQFWHFPTSSWQTIINDWNGETGSGPVWVGQVKNNYSWKPTSGCPALGQYLRFSDVQVQTTLGVWTNAGPSRVLQSFGCFPPYSVGESTVSPAFVHTNH